MVMSAAVSEWSPPSRFRTRLVAVLVVSLCAALFAARLYAHDFWIEPTRFEAQPGDRVPLILRVGVDLAGDRLPYINDWFSDYRVVAPSGPRPITGLLGDDPAGSFEALEPGVHLIGYRSTRDFVEMEPKKFRSYLEEEGLEHVIALRAERGTSERPAREYYSRCAKSLVAVGDPVKGSAFSTILGYTLELVPERNPYGLAPGDSLPLRLLYRGEPIAGVLVQAFAATAPASKVTARTDGDGRVQLRLDRPDLWLVKAVHIIETRADVEGADWESFWASLTFRLSDRG